MLRALSILLAVVAALPLYGADNGDVSFSYAYFALSADPVDSAASARYPGCHRFSWRSTDVLGESDFGTVVSTEFCLRGYLLPVDGVYTADGADTSRSVNREAEGLFVFPAALYGGITFTPLNLKYLQAGVTGGIGLGIAPFPLFFTYVTPCLMATVVPGLAEVTASVTLAPKGVTDRITVRNAFRSVAVSLAVAPLWQGLSVDVGYFNDIWISENAAVTYEDRFGAHGVTVGVTVPLK